jgi:TusA-related sulfurtransferase
MNELIRLGDRISAVLARDARMLDVFLAASPAFAHLRNPILRKTTAKLATVEHAARIAGVDAEDLLARLNGALAGEPIRVQPPRPAHAATASVLPAKLARLAEDAVIDCDVREDLRTGREPFGRILAAARAVREGQALRLRAIFEPAPLYQVLGRQGFEHFTERLADDDWRVWFLRARAVDTPPPSAPRPAVAETQDDLVVLDVRGLEPPEPMVRTLEALEALPRGKTLVQINVRVPQFLLPKLAERGFVHEVREQSADLVRIFIRHA